jgi:hypothetical protein
MTEEQKKATSATEDAVKALKDQADQLRAQTDPFFAAMKSQNDLAAAQRDYDQAVKDHGPTSLEAIAKYNELVQAGFGYEGTLNDLAQKMRESGASTENMTGLLQTLKAYGIDPNTPAAEALIHKVGELEKAASDYAKPYVAVIDADTSAAEAKLSALDRAFANFHRKVDTAGQGFTNSYFQGLDGNWYIKQANGGILQFADGGLFDGQAAALSGEYVHRFAGGGFEDHSAQIARFGTPERVWNERETMGEAYIPLHPNKRSRSLGILGEVAGMFGLTGGQQPPTHVDNSRRSSVTLNYTGPEPRKVVEQVTDQVAWDLAIR